MTVEHGTLRVEHGYPHAVTRVFAAWSDAEVKRRWFMLSDHPGDEWQSDFRVGGVELFRSAHEVTPRVTYDARYHDIVANRRIILTTETTIGGHRTSITLNTAEFEPTADGTTVRVTEQAAFFDGGESERTRFGGIAKQLRQLSLYLARD